MLEISLLERRFHEQYSLDQSRVVIADGLLNGRPLLPDDSPELASIKIEVKLFENADKQDGARVIRITNLGAKLSLPWQSETLESHQTTRVQLPAQIRLGDAYIEFRDSRGILDAGRSFQTISRSRGEDSKPVVDVNLLGQSPGAATLAGWLEALGNLERSDAGSNAMLENTAKAVCDPGGMNGALVILRDNDNWRVKASHVPQPELGIAFSRDLIEQAAEHGQTHFHDASEDLATSSRNGVDSLIAAPVFGADGEVIGIIYGIRSLRGDNLRRGVRPLEALWIQLLAESVSGRLLRMQAEAEAARNRVMLEQVFNGKVVEQLLCDPTILESRDREVTTLFADLRGYSKISEELGPEPTHQLLSEILEHLTECTRAEDGVIIDYYGDGLAAMWNAPTNQPDHPTLACRAAMAMQHGLDAINERWKSKIHLPLRLGIGIHSGIAQVGNSGTKARLKYGPRGQMVVVASRLESATRRTKAKTLISDATRQRLPETAITRRVCRGALPGLKNPLDLYELFSLGDSKLEESVMNRITVYEQALALTEAGKYDEADEILSTITGTAQPANFLAEYLRQNETKSPSQVVDLTSIKT